MERLPRCFSHLKVSHILLTQPNSQRPFETINSRHHQAVDCVALGLEPVAYANDGVIEAIYRPGVLGVQWHPEDLYFEDDRWTQLFKWFLAGLK